MIIGVTGGSGSGKSYVSKHFEKLGFNIIDADIIAKEIMESDSDLHCQIKNHFGIEFFNGNGSVNRRKLGERVYKNKEELALLNSLTHPKINKKITEMAEQNKSNNLNTVIDVPLLVGSPLNDLCDFTVAVICDKEIRVKRIVARDKITELVAQNRIASQPLDEEYVKSTDYVIYNNGNDINEQILEILSKYGSSCK